MLHRQIIKCVILFVVFTAKIHINRQQTSNSVFFLRRKDIWQFIKIVTDKSFFPDSTANKFKYPRIFTYVSMDILLRIRGYFITYPRLRKFFYTENLLFGQIFRNFTE